MRLDIYLKENKNIKSRARAKLLIEDSRVKVNLKVVLSSSYQVKERDFVEVDDMKYVSRAGYKLEYAFAYLNLNIKNKVCLDIGSSTGGFTDYLLQNGAAEVFSVDVGSNQFDRELYKNNENKIKLFENTDIRNADFKNIKNEESYIKNKNENKAITLDNNKKFDIIVCDVSFISLTHIIPSIQKYMSDDGFGVILFKPQFEVGMGNTKKGIVKDFEIVEKVKQDRVKGFQNVGLKVLEIFESGMLGGDGNTEYIFYIKKK